MTTPVLELRSVRGRTQLGPVGGDRPLDLTLAPGQTGVVFGGKETSALFRQILGLGTLDEGEVRVLGRVALTPKSGQADVLQLRQEIGFVFRDKGLLSNISLRDNVDLPAKYHGRYRPGMPRYAFADAALRDLGIEDKLWDLRPSRISSELRKKVALARAIVLEPRVLIMDDPTALVASSFWPELLRWTERQKAKGTGLLIGTNDYPMGLALADWVLHPTRREAVTTYEDFMDPTWIRTAALLAGLKGAS